MALVGKLEVLQPTALFHLNSLFKQTGKLILTTKESTGFLGGPVANVVVAIHIMVDGMIEAVLYGDHVPEGEPIGSVKGPELITIEAGLPKRVFSSGEVATC